MESEKLDQLREEYLAIRGVYESYAEALRLLLSQLLVDIEVESVVARAKDVDSLIAKARSKPEYTSLDQITDKCGVRVVTRYQADVITVCELIAREFAVTETVVHGSERPDAFGYASRHLLVEVEEPRATLQEWQAFRGLRAEIQVRSILQHAWAAISHGLDYKTGADLPPVARRRLFRVAALLETGDELFDSFRQEVARIRSEYQEDVRTDEWRALGLDLDSIREAWQKLPMQALVDAAVKAGWQRSGRRPLGHDPPTNEEDVGRVRRLLELARALDYSTLGELVEATLEPLSKDSSALERFAEQATEAGYTPYALGPDIATLMLVAKDPQPAILRRVDDIGPPFASALMTTALAGEDASDAPETRDDAS